MHLQIWMCQEHKWVADMLAAAFIKWEQFWRAPGIMMSGTKNAVYFTSKALFVLKMFSFLSGLFGYITKQLD